MICPRHRAVLIGAGRVGWGYDEGRPEAPSRTHGGCLLRHPDVELVGIVDPDADALSRVAADLDAARKGRDTALDTDLGRLAELAPSLVSICSPTILHEAHLRAALSAGARHVWLEKPATGDPAALERVLDVCAQAPNPPRVQVNYMRRALPQARRLRELARGGGALGRPVAIECRYSRRLDVNGVHMVDLAAFALDLTHAPDLAWSQADPTGANPSFGFQANGVEVSVLGRELPYHLVELDLIGTEGRACLPRDDGPGILARREPTPGHLGFFRLGAPEPLLEEPTDGVGGDALYAMLCNLLGDAPLASPLGASRVVQGLVAQACAP